MTKTIPAKDITLDELNQIFGLTITYDPQLFTEWREDLPELTDFEKQQLDRVKQNYINLVSHHPISENMVKMVVVEHLFDLADFYSLPFYVTDEKTVELAVEDEDTVVRGRLDFLVLKERLWFAIVESKKSGISLRPAIPQTLVYMLANPQSERPIFGFLINGDDYLFLKLTRQNTAQYALSKKFTLMTEPNELYDVLRIIKKLSQLIVPEQ